MANGIEDLREKNKGRIQPDGKHYTLWKNHYGKEDAEMLQEKSSGWNAWRGGRRNRHDDEAY